MGSPKINGSKRNGKKVHQVSNADLIKKATMDGRDKQNAQNELVRRGVSWT